MPFAAERWGIRVRNIDETHTVTCIRILKIESADC